VGASTVGVNEKLGGDPVAADGFDRSRPTVKLQSALALLGGVTLALGDGGAATSSKHGAEAGQSDSL
jgi:hypothetical protein